MVVNTRRDVNARRDRDGERPRWIYGINAVMRRLEVSPRSVRELRMLHGDSARRGRLAELARATGIAVREADAETLRRLTGTEQHQGVAAHADPYEYHDLSTILIDAPGPLLLLDQVQDPHNLGALIRTAAAVGMAAVVLPRHGAAGVSPAVEKVAAGAVNDVPVCLVPNLHRCLLDLRRHGYWSIALTPSGGENLFTLDLSDRPALVLGGETGLRQLVAETCDLRAVIPVRPGIDSLNASVAGAVAMYEVARRRQHLDRSGGGW
jgi:23S rRNA (guanosine2251-2'-O)-methyltransferase